MSEHTFTIKGWIPTKKNMLTIRRPKFRAGGWISPSKKYQDWELGAAKELMVQRIEQGFETITQRVNVSFLIFYFQKPGKQEPDLSNLIQSCEDAMVKAGILQDDSLIVGFDGSTKCPVKTKESAGAIIRVKVVEWPGELRTWSRP
jgi:Holliday junction resolvase RusA-like endonuclease